MTELTRFSTVVCIVALTMPAYSAGLLPKNSNFDTTIFELGEKYWQVLPSQLAVPDDTAPYTDSLGYALLVPEMIANRVCITKSIPVVFRQGSDRILLEAVDPVVAADISYHVAFFDINKASSCSTLSFEHAYFAISQPIDTARLLSLRALLSVVAEDERAMALSEDRDLESIRISRLNVEYSGEFRDLIYRVSVADKDGALLSIEVGQDNDRLKILNIIGLAE